MLCFIFGNASICRIWDQNEKKNRTRSKPGKDLWQTWEVWQSRKKPHKGLSDPTKPGFQGIPESSDPFVRLFSILFHKIRPHKVAENMSGSKGAFLSSGLKALRWAKKTALHVKYLVQISFFFISFNPESSLPYTHAAFKIFSQPLWSLRGYNNQWLVGMIAQACEYTKNHGTIHFTKVKFMLCELYLNNNF